jgi:death-on-curing protein
MIEITRKILVGLHHDILRRAQASGEDVVWGVLYEGNLEALIYRINKSEDLFEKAAWALYSADCHPFYDGQKRTAHQLADLILRSEGYHIHAVEEEVIDMLLKIARYEYQGDIPKIVMWLKENVREVDRSRQLHFG